MLSTGMRVLWLEGLLGKEGKGERSQMWRESCSPVQGKQMVSRRQWARMYHTAPTHPVTGAPPP